MYTEEVYKTALSSDDDKRLQTFDNTTTHLNKTNAFKLCESEVLMVMKYKDLLLNDKNHIKETNTIFKIIVAKCILNRSIRFRKSEMFNVMKYKDFLTDNIDHIKKTNGIFKVINAKSTMNRSILLCESF